MAVFSPLPSPVFSLTLAPPVILFPLRKTQRSHLALMAAAAVGTLSTRFQGAGPGVTAGVPAVLEDSGVQQSSQGRPEAGTAVFSHSNTLPPTLFHGTQHQLNASTAQPPSDGDQLLVLIPSGDSELLAPAPFSLLRQRVNL